MPRPIHATVHTQALRHNLERARQSALDARVWAVVKANAYGHGIARVFEGLRGADGFALPQVDEISLMAHFSDADGNKGIAQQMHVFQQHTQDLPGERSLSNSAAILRHCAAAEVRADWVRAGIALYGSAPDFPQHSATDWDLQPAMSLSTKIIGTQDLVAGDRVGYGSSFVAEGNMRIGVAACGYADGYPRLCPTGTPILVDGIRTRTLGRVSMDMIGVDLTPLQLAGVQAGFGSEVTLWGRSRSGAVLSIDEVAHAAGTLGYELMCALAQRVPTSAD